MAQSPDATDIPQNVWSCAGIPLKRGTSGVSDKPSDSGESKSLREPPPQPRGSRNVRLGRVKRVLSLSGTRAKQPRLTIVSRDVTYPTRSVSLIPRPAKVCPLYWIGTIGQQHCYQLSTDDLIAATCIYIINASRNVSATMTPKTISEKASPWKRHMLSW